MADGQVIIQDNGGDGNRHHKLRAPGKDEVITIERLDDNSGATKMDELKNPFAHVIVDAILDTVQIGVDTPIDVNDIVLISGTTFDNSSNSLTHPFTLTFVNGAPNGSPVVLVSTSEALKVVSTAPGKPGNSTYRPTLGSTIDTVTVDDIQQPLPSTPADVAVTVRYRTPD